MSLFEMWAWMAIIVLIIAIVYPKIEDKYKFVK